MYPEILMMCDILADRSCCTCTVPMLKDCATYKNLGQFKSCWWPLRCQPEVRLLLKRAYIYAHYCMIVIVAIG